MPRQYINTLLSLIEKQKNDNKKDILVLKEENISLKEEIFILKEENKKQNKEIYKLNQDIKQLTEMHKKIYFRDVSKFYIEEFAYSNNIKGENTYTLCQNILSFDFTKSANLPNLKDIITKIVSHYINGNKIVHREYFIAKTKSLNKIELTEEIENTHMGFMKFNNQEKKLLSKNFKLKYVSSFFHYHKFQ